MKVWIFNHYAQPPKYPGGTRHYDLSESLSELGCDVTIFSSSFHYTLLKEQLPSFKLSSTENYNGVNFVLLRTVSYKKNGLRRFLNICSYPVSLLRHLIFSKIVKPDIIIGSTVHPFAALIGCVIAKFFKVPHVFEIRDLWPETFIDMKIWKRDSLIAKFFYAIEKYTVKNSDAYIVLSPMTTDYLLERYSVMSSNILVLPNGVNKNFYSNIPSACTNSDNDKIVIKYVGGIDSVHGLDFLVDIAAHLPESYSVVLVGDGKDKERLISKVNTSNIKNVTFMPPIPKNDVPKELSNSDLLFLSTADVFYGSENKLYEYMSAAKPIVVASNANHNNPVTELDCGIVLDRNDILASSAELQTYIKNNYNNFDKIGLNGYDYVVNNRTTKILSEKLFSFLTGIR